MSEQQQAEWTDEQDRAPADTDTGNDDVSRETLPGSDEDTDTGDDVSRETDEDEDTDTGDEDGDEDEQDTDKSKLRGEAAKYRRQRNEQRDRADKYGQRLFTELVRSTGRLTDPSDMPVDTALLEDTDKLNSAIDKLLESKPHLKARQFKDMGQHDRGAGMGVSLGEILRRNS